MESFLAYAAVAITVGLAVVRPHIKRWSFRFSPGSAAVVGVLIVLCAGLVDYRDLFAAAQLQWRPLLTLACIMVMTGVVQEVGAFDRLACWIEGRARGKSAANTFTLVFVLSVVTPSLLNNDAAILALTPLIVALTRRLYPDREALTVAFAFAVFLAPGVAPFIVSNPMNMIVAEYAGLGFNDYARVMLPISLVGAAITYVVLRVLFRNLLRTKAPAGPPNTMAPRHPGERPAVILLVAVFLAYPIAATFGLSIWLVAVAGAVGAVTISVGYKVTTLRQVGSHVSVDILAFLWGIFLVVQGLRAIGVVDWLSSLYQQFAPGSGGEVAAIGAVSALGSALIDNHPMSILNMMAIDSSHDAHALLAALVGGDIGPRLLPIGSLAGLLWIDLLRRSGIEIGIGRFLGIGSLVLVPTLTVSLVMLWLL